ncbi:retrovirus-related pol polyprotein from transposon TNT 1-94 [Tanacetum coccineum]
MSMPSKDKMYNGRKGIGFENPSYFCKAKELRLSLYDERVIGLGYTLMFLTHLDKALEIEKFKREKENKIEFVYDYGNLNESCVNEKINFLDDYFQEIINPDFEKIDSPFQQRSSLKPYVPTMILENIIIDLEDEVVSILEKENENLEIIESLKSKGFESTKNAISESENQRENDLQMVEKDCNNLENSKVIAPGMFKINVSQSVSPISVSKTTCASNNVENKTKRKIRKRTSSKQHDKQVNNDLLRANRDFVHFSDLDTLSSVRRSKHSSVIWKKKVSSNTSCVDLSTSRNSNLNKNAKRYSLKVLLACDNSHHVDTRSAHACNDSMNVSYNSRLHASYKSAYDLNDWYVYDDHMNGNRALLMNSVKKFHGTVQFGNDDFTMIAGYEDMVIVSMTIKKVYYVKGLGHNLFGVGQFCDKGLEVAFQKSSSFVQTKDGVDLLTGDHSLNLYIIALNDIASNLLVCLLAKASSSQYWLWHQRFSYLKFATINNLVKNNLVRGLTKMKFKYDHFCSAYEQGKIHRKHHKCYLLNDYDDVRKLKAKGDIAVFVGYSKEYVAFRSYNKRTRKIHKSMNVNFDEIFEMAPKQFSLEPGLSNLNETEKSLNTTITKSPTTNVETSNEEIPLYEEEVFHEISNLFQEESTSSSLNDDVQQTSEEVVIPLNTQSVLNKIVPNVDEASTSHDMFNDRLEDASFDASTTFHDPYNVHTFYQPYPHETKWTRDHPLHKIIGDPNYKLANVAEALKDDAWAIRLFLAYTAHKDFTVFQMDVNTAFLNGILKEEVYDGQPPSFVSKQYPNHVYALDRALYGLKQAPRA